MMGVGYERLMDSIMQAYSGYYRSQFIDSRNPKDLICSFVTYNVNRKSVGCHEGYNVVLNFYVDRDGYNNKRYMISNSGLIYTESEFDSLMFMIDRYFSENECLYDDGDNEYTSVPRINMTWCHKCGNYIDTIHLSNLGYFERNRQTCHVCRGK